MYSLAGHRAITVQPKPRQNLKALARATAYNMLPEAYTTLPPYVWGSGVSKVGIRKALAIVAEFSGCEVQPSTRPKP